MKKKFKILAIDGGGIKGLYSSTILQKFEKTFTTKIGDHFDMICGTSTGGLIALGLSKGVSANEISELYATHGKNIFPKKRNKWYRQVLWRGKYENTYLKKVLTDLYEKTTIGELNNLVCIPSYCITNGTPRVFKYNHGELTRDSEIPIIDVALATSAAPTYLPIYNIETDNDKQYIDGGVWANNPTLVGLVEALKFFVGEDKEYDAVDILSVSSLVRTSGKPTNWSNNRSFYGWKDELPNIPLRAQSHFTDYFMKTLSEKQGSDINYVRITSATVSDDQAKYIELDNVSEQSITLLQSLGKDTALIWEKKEEVKAFFKERKTFLI